MIERHERGRQDILAQLGLVRTSLWSCKASYMRSSGYLKSKLISFCEMNKIANVHITANPGAQGSRGKHNPWRQLLFQKACWAFITVQLYEDTGKESLCVQRTGTTAPAFSQCQEATTAVQGCVTTGATNISGTGKLPVTREDGAYPWGLNHSLEDSAPTPRSQAL